MSSRSTESKNNRLQKKIKITKRKVTSDELQMYDKILTEVSSRDKYGTSEWSQVIGDNQNPIDQMKYQICQSFIRLVNQTGIPQIRLAEIIGVDRARINNIVHGRFHLFSLEILITYLFKIEGLSPQIDQKIAEIRRLTQP